MLLQNRSGGLVMIFTIRRFSQTRFDEFRKPEIQNFRMTIPRHHNVVGFQITMHDTRGMSLRQSFGDVLQVTQKLLQFGPLPMNLLAQSHAIDKLHGNEVGAVVLSDLEDLRNVWVTQRRSRLCFANESLHAIAIRRDVGWKNL